MKNLNKTIFIYLGLSAFAFIFNKIYAIFSHGVSSNAMSSIFFWILLLGAGCYTAIRLLLPDAANHKAYRFFYNLYNSGIAILSIGMLLQGILEIAGGTSSFIKFYYYIAYMFIAAGAGVFIKIAKEIIIHFTKKEKAEVQLK